MTRWTGINTCIWTTTPSTASFASLAARVAASGTDAMEIPVYGDNPLAIGVVRRALADAGIGISAVTGLRPEEDLGAADGATARRGIEALRMAIDLAAGIGSPLLSGAFYTAGPPTYLAPADRASLLDRLVERLVPLAAYAGTHGVTLCLEPLNRYETAVLNTVAQARMLVERVADPHCKLLLDTFHLGIEETSVPAAIRAAGPWLAHIHANESHRGVVGTGTVPWSDVADALAAIDYTGGLVVEAFDWEDPSVAIGGHAWRAHATSTDALAAQSIAFLHERLVRPVTKDPRR